MNQYNNLDNDAVHKYGREKENNRIMYSEEMAAVKSDFLNAAKCYWHLSLLWIDESHSKWFIVLQCV